MLSQASAIGQRARGGGWAAGVTDLTFVSAMGVEERKGGGALEGNGGSDDFHARFVVWTPGGHKQDGPASARGGDRPQNSPC